MPTELSQNSIGGITQAMDSANRHSLRENLPHFTNHRISIAVLGKAMMTKTLVLSASVRFSIE